MTAMQEIAKSLTAPFATVIVMAVLYEGGADLVSLTLGLLIAMASILYVGGSKG